MIVTILLLHAYIKGYIKFYQQIEEFNNIILYHLVLLINRKSL